MRSRSPLRSALSLLLAFMLLALASPAAAVPGGSGKGGGGGGGQGGGGGGKGELFAELVVAYRDADGLPILIGPFETEHSDAEYCVQPVTTEPVPHPYRLLPVDHELYDPGAGDMPATENEVDGRTVTIVPLFAHFQEFLPDLEEENGDHGGGGGGGKGKGGRAADVSPTHKPGDPDDPAEGGEPCDPLVIPTEDGTFNYAQFVSEVELERLNLARSPDHVLARHLREVEALLVNTDPALVTLDPAGRPLFDGFETDAMPKLQAIRESLLETGTIPGAGAAYPFPFGLVSTGFDQWDTFELSAFALGGAASKFGWIDVDAVIYHDRIMGIADDWVAGQPLWAPRIHEHEITGELFVDYSGFAYDRDATFPGCVTYLDPSEWWEGYKVESLLEVVGFPTLLAKRDNVAGYAQMANDARAVIYFIHLYDSVIAYADPVGMDSPGHCQEVADELNDYLEDAGVFTTLERIEAKGKDATTTEAAIAKAVSQHMKKWMGGKGN